MNKGFIPAGGFQFAYTTIGEGEEVWVLFHGFGMNKDSFLPAFQHLSKAFIICSIDLPYHGDTIPTDAINQETIWTELIDNICQKFSVTKINLFGFSIGARAVLHYLQHPQQKVERVILTAADGFYDNFYFHWATKTFLGKRLFKWVVDNPSKLVAIVKTFQSLKILNKQQARLAKSGLESQERLEQVYQVWKLFAGFEINLDAVLNNIETRKINMLILAGNKDKVINPKPAQKFAKSSKRVCFRFIDAPHHFGFPKVQKNLSAEIDHWLTKTMS